MGYEIGENVRLKKETPFWDSAIPRGLEGVISGRYGETCVVVRFSYNEKPCYVRFYPDGSVSDVSRYLSNLEVLRS